MTSPSVIEMEALIEPIAGDQPQGVNIREDSAHTATYYEIKDARNAARAAERAPDFDDDDAETDRKQGDISINWKRVLAMAPVIITETSKDLEVLSWYLEALLRLHGFAGLRDGLSLIREIVDRFWDDLYPEPDEDGMETKVAPLSGLNGEGREGALLEPIRTCPITVEGHDGAFSYGQCRQAIDANQISGEEAKQDRFNTLGFTLSDIQATITPSNIDFYADMLDDLEVCSEQFQLLTESLMAKCGADAPPTTYIRELLEEVLRSVRFLTDDLLRDRNAVEADAPVADAGSGESQAATGTNRGVSGSSGPIASREDALKRLVEVAQYFRIHEPHTPLAPAIDRIVAWGRMTLSELMMELVPDNTARAVLTQLTGVKLDGSDTQQYVAPPPVTSADTPAADDSGSNSGIDTPAGDESGPSW